MVHRPTTRSKHSIVNLSTQRPSLLSAGGLKHQRDCVRPVHSPRPPPVLPCSKRRASKGVRAYLSEVVGLLADAVVHEVDEVVPDVTA